MKPRGHQPIGLALLAAAVIVLAGCFSVESNFTINDDGTADIELVTLIDTEQLGEFAELFGQDVSELDGLSGEDLLQEVTQGDDPCGDLAGSLTGYDTSVQEIDDGSQVGVSCTVLSVPLEDLNSIGADSSFVIEQDDSGTRFSAVLEGVDELTGESDEVTQLLDIDFEDIFSIVFTVTAPGSLGENNATSTSGATATWDIATDAAFVTVGAATMTAEWTPGGESNANSWIALIVAALVIVVIVGAVLFVRHRNRRAASAGNAAPIQPSGPDTPPAAPPGASPATPPPPPPPPAGAGPPPPPPPSPGPPPASSPPPPPPPSN